MEAKTNTPQEQPAEGDRDTINRELKRQDEKLAKDNRKTMDKGEPAKD